ncbi:MAG: M20/M25/M40 family metallo-hydrolase [Candidatus Lokiarchaeota archaeon]|nr:M20/M25/M40 family metallo-hydrolase [Candidatus Lokiarchaeota archaeon]
MGRKEKKNNDNQKKRKNKLNRLSKFSSNSDIEKEAIELLQECVRTETVNPPGNEMVLAKKLQEIFEAENNPLIATKIIETVPSRGNLIATITGSDPDNYPCWGFASHLDVVPIESESDWKYPPFSAELVQMEHDKFIWGRGTFDMKYIGVSQIMALFTHLREGFQPKGNIRFIFESDEERGGQEGMKILVEKYWEEVKVDCLITEGGGFKLPIGKDFAIQVGEKGKCQTRIKATGVPGHGSTPGSYDKFALYKMVEILNKIKETKQKIYMTNEYKNTINALSLPKIAKFLLKRKSIIKKLLAILSKATKQPFDKFFLPMITDTIAPTIVKCGQKENVISPYAELTLDIRTLPDHNHDFIYEKLENIIGEDLFKELELSPVDEVESTTSPINTDFYDILFEVTKSMYPGANLVPLFDVAGTDMKYHRKKGIPCYGFSFLLKDPDLSYEDLVGMSHAPNERISVTNLMLATEFVYRLIKRL